MDSNNGLNQTTEPVVEVTNAQGTRVYDGRLTRRFIAGILIGFLVSVLVVSAAVLSLLYVYKGNGVPGT